MTISLQPVSQALPSDRSDIDLLLDASFGTDRHDRTAYRLRDGNSRLDDLGLVVRRDDGHLCGSIEFWPIDLVCQESGFATAAVLLGPIAVSDGCRGQGVGGALMRNGIAAAKAAGHDTIVLVGDPAYYSRFGFSDEKTRSWALPGPFEQHRLLAIASGEVPTAAMLRGSLALGEPDERRQAEAQK